MKQGEVMYMSNFRKQNSKKLVTYVLLWAKCNTCRVPYISNTLTLEYTRNIRANWNHHLVDAFEQPINKGQNLIQREYSTQIGYPFTLCTLECEKYLENIYINWPLYLQGGLQFHIKKQQKHTISNRGGEFKKSGVQRSDYYLNRKKRNSLEEGCWKTFISYEFYDESVPQSVQHSYKEGKVT